MIRLRHSGFTLLEILIVIIIVGVLASVALPSYFRHVEAARGTEALQTVGIVRRALEACAMQTGSYTPCISGPNGFDSLAIEDPTATPGTHFIYRILVSGVPGCQYDIHAVRNTLDGGDISDTIEFGLYNNTLYLCGLGNYSSMSKDCTGPVGSCYP
jgi:prepilin-type N-terminal cleavage/methylation domain-containing protein